MPGAEEPGLKGLSILVTRPVAQSVSLVAAIQSMGGIAYSFPLIEIQPVSPCPEVLEGFSGYNLVIFVSQNAVDCAWPCLTNDFPASARLAAVGQATAAAMERHGQPPDIVPARQFDTEGLLAMPDLESVTGQRVLIVRGAGGRELLAETLRDRGAIVDYAEVYRREPTEQVLTYSEDEIDVILVTSSEALENLRNIAQQSGRLWLTEKPLLVIHERIAVRAGELGFKLKPVVAEQASDAAMLEALQTMRHRAPQG